VVSEALVQLASYAELRGIDWPSLNAEGKGVLDSTDYLDELEARWQQFYAVAETLAITDAEWETTTAAEAKDAWTEVADSVGASASAMLDAISEGELSVAMDQAATIWTGALRTLVIATSAVSHRNMTAHSDGTFLYAIEAGDLTVEQVEDEASAVASLWDAVVQLDDWGALSSLKKPEFGGAAGLGTPAAAAGQAVMRGLPWVITGVLVAAVVAAVIVFLAYLSDRNEQIEKFCFTEDGSLRADRPGWCDEAGQGMPDPLAVFMKPAEEFGKRMATMLGVAALVYVAIYALPHVLTAFARRKAAA
jgi:hypothetical protein